MDDKTLVFDTGPIISLTLNNLLWMLEPLKEKFKGDFIISEETKKELIDRPIETRRFKFEAYQIRELLNKGVLKEVTDPDVESLGERILDVTNRIYYIKGQPLRIIHKADAYGLALACQQKLKCFVVDERTARLLVENPIRLKSFLEKRFYRKIQIDKDSLNEFGKIAKDVRLIRSVDIATVAYELGLLNKYAEDKTHGNDVLDAVMWGLKLNGCAVSEDEMREIIKLESKM